MGQDKLPLKIGNATLLDRVTSAVASRCEEVLVVGESSYASAGFRWVPDLRPGRQGPLAGIEAGLSAARHQAVFVAAGDMPFLTSELIGYLLDLLAERFRACPKSREGYRQGALEVEKLPTPYSLLPTPRSERSEATKSEATSAVVPDFERLHPLCAAYDREVRPSVSAALDGGVRSVRAMLKSLPRVRYVGEVELWRFGDPAILLSNVNSPEDLARARLGNG